MNSQYPDYRPRRLRRNENLRGMVRETLLSPFDFIAPMFVVHGKSVKREIPSMPDIYHYSIDMLAEEIDELTKLKIPAVILFGIPQKKDPIGKENYAEKGIVQKAIRVIKDINPNLIVITDVCLCEYTDHGHCGLLGEKGVQRNGFDTHNKRFQEIEILNDQTLPVLNKVVVSHADAGADIVAPSGMMDGMVSAIRNSLDGKGFNNVSILSYSAKYASAFYGPFRDAADSAPQFGDRQTYQMDPANVREAIREVALDIQEGADIVMIKPALPYLDVLRQVRDCFDHPLAAYNVSGEYAMVKAAAQKGWLNERKTALESLLSIKRAGADMIISYWAKSASKWLEENHA